MSMRPSGDTARGLVFDDFVDKQVVHVSATSFRSGAERVSMYVSMYGNFFTAGDLIFVFSLEIFAVEHPISRS